ncbi:MAG: DMT family transporter [Sphingobium sp.]
MPFIYIVIAFWAGAVLPLQAAMNARLAKAIGGPIWAATFTSLAVAATLIVAGGLLLRTAPRTADLPSVPWWAWLSGICGAIFLGGTTFAIPKLGAANLVALVMAGQIICAMMLDSFGLLGLTAQPVSPQRILAAAMLVGGAALMSTR